MAIKNILILHGWESNPREHWYLKAKEKFEKRGYKVFVPELPGAYFPKKEEWVKVIKDFKPDSSWILIGHSLGGVAILKYLETSEVPVAKVILIAAPFDAMKFNPIANFFDGGFNFQEIINKSNKFIILSEDNDPIVPLDHGIQYQKNLRGDHIIKKGYLHFDRIDFDFLENLI